MSTNVHPEILDGLEYESQFIQRTSGAQRRVVKLNRGDSWLLRFLPAQLGPNKRWYARVAKHWVNQRAIVCPRQTEEAFGGHPEAYCSVCDLSAHLNDERNEEVSKFGFKLRATPNWITYCAVFAKATQGGQEQAMALPEVLQPYEFPHYKTSWEELTGFVKQGVRRTPMSVLDLEKGNDFYVSKTNKGLRLDKQDTGPIFDLNDPNFDAHCQKLLAACKDPVVKIPDEKALDTFADKAQEEANNIARGGGGGRNARGGGVRGGQDEDDLPPDDAPPARGGRNYSNESHEAPPARGRTAPPAEAPPARRAAAPPQEAPARRAAPAPAPAPAARRAPAPAPAPEPEQEPPPEDQGDQPPVDEGGDQQPEEQQEPAPAPAPPLRRAPAPAPAPARPAASRPSATPPRAAAPAPARTAAPAPARTAAPAPARGGAVAQESLDEEEHVPEEATDQAPPAPLVDPADDTGAGDQGDQGGGEEPPPVENTRRGQFSSTIRSKINAANNSAKK